PARCDAAAPALPGAPSAPGNRAADPLPAAWCCLAGSRLPVLLLALLVLGDDRPRDAEAIDADRGAAIDQDLRQRRADLIRGESIVERAAHMGGELLHLAERRDHAEIEDRALARFQRLVAPGLAPAIFGEDALKIAVEVVDVGQRTVDIGVAQNLLTFGK